MLRPFSEPAPAWQARPFGNTAPAAGVVTNAADTPADEAPLTKEELDALALVQNAMAPEVLRKKAAAIAGRLYGAMTGKREMVANACNQHKHDKDSKGKWTNLGRFESLKGICDKPIRVNRWINFKGKGKHRIKKPIEKVRQVLAKNDFSLSYEGSKDVVNVYAALPNTQGKTKYYKVGLNTETGEPTTIFPTSKTDYEKARKKTEQ